MSLSHLGKFSEPVFDAALPAKPTIFPVARRVVSHAARSLFAGKLLFPVAIPGKEGQHCFASDPRRLFRMPRVKHSSVSVLPAVVSRTNHTFAPPPHAQIQPRQRLDFSPCKLPPRPELRPRAPASIGAPVLSLAEACAQPSIRLSRPPVKNLREPLYFQKCLISRFEISRLRRMAQASDWQSVSKPPADLVPASPLPEPWNWFALSARGRADRSSVMTRPLQAGPLDPPRPRLLYPTATRRPSLMPPLWKFLAHGRHAVSAWRPVCRLPTGPLSILSLQRRLPFAELLPEGPPPAPIDRDVYLSIYISDALSIRPHSFIAEFSHGRSRVRPAAHSGIAPVFHPDARLAAPTAHSGTVTEIITNIARARLADIRGVPPARLARKWPHAVFRPLRQLLFRKPFAKRFDFPPPEPPGFNVIAPRSFASLRPVSGDLRAAMKNEPDAARAKPAERRSRSSFSHSPMERFLAKTGLHLPDARVSDLRISAIQPAPVMCPGGATRKGVRQALGMPERRAVAEKALFTPREKQRTTFRTSAVPAQPNVHASELRVPVPAMQVLCLTAAPRGPRPLALPRRLPPAGEPERMLRLIASLPRRAHSTRHYLLTLESNLMPWKQRSQPRRTRVALPRELLVPRSPSFAREVMLPQDFQAVSPASKRAFLTTGISTAFLSLREAALPASLRIAHDRPR
ncbi:MAG TPA: hypothetical protein PLY73_10710, partial [Candidatus Ozemobacteraceae bacterium]|nr:hypothetical protein [Candidatus Ozemobacteraceae bacterium]